ncbi:hypothetical protein JYT31_01695 [Beggiatoa alba]|nr:hypothetical protein [Beggiatoa alba]
MPEPVLVAMTAMHHTNLDWLDEDKLFTASPDALNPLGPERVKYDHLETCKRVWPMAAYRRAESTFS